ncbi:MAG: glycosyltransferase family 4 protein [Methylacidiphilales bacterium]|nr:glycosyltransferase family 4 protein [Candidatus Methylacidiphilales bacterium]
MKISYLIPEFPGQTHIWIWREISHLREWGIEIDIFSTKRPSLNVKANHKFSTDAEQETYYLWKQNLFNLFTDSFWAIFTHPLGFLKCIFLALTINIDTRPKLRLTLPLIFISCVLAREISKRNIEHLHCHSCANSAILAMMVKRLTGTPYSLTLNANIEWWGGAMKEKFSDAKFTIAIAKWLFEQIQQDYPNLREEQVVLGRIGVDTKKWICPTKNQHHRVFHIISVGRLHPSKGHIYLIQAVKSLVDLGEQIELTIIGAGSESENLMLLVNELQLSDTVQFIGSQSEEEIIKYMQQANAFVLSSHAEPLGVVYMEAMSMQLPTIGTNAGGVPEIISNGDDGLLVEARNHQALAEAIASLIRNPQLCLKLGQNARQKIIQNFDSRIGAATLYQCIFGSLPNDYLPLRATDVT